MGMPGCVIIAPLKFQTTGCSILMAHGAVDVIDLEGLKQSQDLDVLPFALFAHPGLQG